MSAAAVAEGVPPSIACTSRDVASIAFERLANKLLPNPVPVEEGLFDTLARFVEREMSDELRYRERGILAARLIEDALVARQRRIDRYCSEHKVHWPSLAHQQLKREDFGIEEEESGGLEHYCGC
jgi:hypothetical protein|eukprot:COSAG01_NODE_897_length_12874_cov_17.636115_7_plen_125_part_00